MSLQHDSNGAIERLRLIARIASGLHGEQTLDDVLQRAADAIHQQLGFPNVDIPLIDADDPGVLVIRVRGGHYKTDIRHEDRIALDRGVMAAAIRERRSLRIDDVRSEPRYVCPPGVVPAGAELAVPIVGGGVVLGVLNVEGEGPFDALDQMSLEIVADFLAVAIRNAQLLPQARAAAVLLERQRLARDLHDSVTQIFSAISLLTQTLDAAYVRDADEGSRRVQRLQQLAQAGFAEMRALLRELAPDETADPLRRGVPLDDANGDTCVDRGLVDAIQRLLDVMTPEPLFTRLLADTYLPQCDEHEQALYRICQEAISNAVRHASGTRLMLSLAVTVDEAVLVVADDGCGIDPDRSSGHGLANMRSRLLDAGGDFRIVPNHPSGTRLEARLPRRDRALVDGAGARR